MNAHSSEKIRTREIGAADIPAVAALLARGFPARSESFWRDVLLRLWQKPTPGNYPKIGYMLERAALPVGALLLIFSAFRDGATETVRCNLSSWYVEAEFRSFAPFLVTRALKHKNVTFLNVSSVPHTRPIVEAQGFTRYSNGMLVALPALFGKGEDVRVVNATDWSPRPADVAEHRLLLDHAAFGCLSLWCEGADGARPFVFRPRRVKKLIPCMQLVYCRAIADFAALAGPLGRYLAFRGRPLVVTDADGPLPAIPGFYIAGKLPKYFRGPQKPRLGDLAYTETAMFGF